MTVDRLNVTARSRAECAERAERQERCRDDGAP
jgi:hypothetical protein